MALPEIPAGFELETPDASTSPALPPIPEGFEVEQPAQSAPVQPPARQPEPISDIVGRMASGRPAGNYGLTPSARSRGVQFSEKQSKINDAEQTSNVLKYGPAVAAGPLVGAASVPIQMGAMALAGAAGSTFEQATGDRPFSGKEVAATAVESAIPMFRFTSITPFMSAAKTAGITTARAGATGATSAALTEAGSAIRDWEGYKAPKTTREAMDRLFSPAAFIGAGFSTLGSAGERVAARGAVGEAVRAERGTQAGPAPAAGEPARTASVMLTDVLPQYAPLEARRIIARDSKALSALRDMTVNIDDAILKQFADAPNAQKIAADLAPAVGKLKSLQEAARSAQATADSAEQAYQQAVMAGRSDIQGLRAAAAETALEASKQRSLYDLGLDKTFGQQKPALAALAPAQNTENLTKLLDNTFKAQGESLGALYERAGVGLNEPVVNRATLVNAINRRSAETGSMLRGNEAKRAALEQIDSLFGGSDTLTLEQFRNARNAIANGLGESPLFASSAEKLAGDTYSAFREATDDFIRKTSPDKFPAWKDANRAAAQWYKARDSDFIRDFVDPNTGTLRQGKAGEFVNALTAGKTEGFTDLAKLADSIAGTGEPAAIAAADQFRKGVSQYIATGVLDSAVTNRATGLASDAASFDPKKLYTTLNKLQSQGFPVDSLEMGTPKDINALARIAESKAVTKAELSEFFQNVGTLGGDVAAARLQYRRNLVDNLMGLGARDKVSAIRETQSLARRARIDGATAQRELAAAKNDPLVKLFEEGSFGFSSDPTKLADGAISSLSRYDAPTVRRFMDALPASTADQIRQVKASQIFADYASPVVAGVRPNAPIEKISDLFNNPTRRAELASVREIMGQAEFKNMQDLVKQINPVLGTREKLSRAGYVQSNGAGGDIAGGFGVASGMAQGRIQGGFGGKTSINIVNRLLDSGRYNTLYYLYINPNSASVFRKLGYSTDKLLAQSGLHRVALQVAADKDDAATQEKQAP